MVHVCIYDFTFVWQLYTELLLYYVGVAYTVLQTATSCTLKQTDLIDFHSPDSEVGKGPPYWLERPRYLKRLVILQGPVTLTLCYKSGNQTLSVEDLKAEFTVTLSTLLLKVSTFTVSL